MVNTTESFAGDDWYRPCAADLARQVVQPDRSGQDQNYGNLVKVVVGGIDCYMDEIHALSLGWDYTIVQNVPVFSKEFVLSYCPDVKMKWVEDPQWGTPVFQPDEHGDIFIAVETFIYLVNENDMAPIVQTLRQPHPHHRSCWVGARRLI